MIKKIVTSFILFIILISNIFTQFCEAAFVPVTMENLKSTIEEFLKEYNDSENEYKIEIDGNVLKFDMDGEVFYVECDLTNKPTFKMIEEVKKGISYEKFNKRQEFVVAQLFCYIAVAKIQGAKFEDATLYIMFSYFGGMVEQAPKNGMTIVDDINNKNIQKEEKENVIYTSEFGEKVLEYIDKYYSQKITISDSDSDMLNSFTYTIEKIDKTEDSRELISILSINPETDFSRLEEFSDFEDEDITSENADYVVKLKIGEKYKFNTNVTGYVLYNNDCVEINTSTDEILAKSPGKSYGHIYLENDVEKTIYIEVEKNTETPSDIDKNNNTSTETNTNTTENKDNNTNNQNITKIPNAGYHDSDTLYFLYFIISLSIIGIFIKLYKKSNK